MTLNKSQEWERAHFREILSEIKQEGIELDYKNIPQIIAITSFKSRSKKHPGKCPYYQKQPPESCHPETEDLNCFLCACPNYESHKLEGGCKINSSSGKIQYHKNLPAGKIWDCSDCAINHRPEDVRKFLRQNIDKLKEIIGKI